MALLSRALDPKRLRLVLWVARFTGIALFLFWGAFFVEHLAEWFTFPLSSPPAWVWGALLIHFVLLAGLLIALKYELVGALMIFAASLVFFLVIIGVQGLIFFVITSIPAVLYLVHWAGLRNQ